VRTLRTLSIIACLAALAAPSVAVAQGGKGNGNGNGKGKDKDKAARVDHLGTLPAPGGVGANFKRYADGKTYMFVTASVSGLHVYDVTDGDAPQLATTLPLVHYQNEDVSIGGNRLLISGDGTAGGSNLTVVDISNPTLPKVEQVINMAVLGEGHTATCIQDCRYVWAAGDANIAVIDLEARAQFERDELPSELPDIQVQAASSQMERGDLRDPSNGNRPYHEFGWSTHDVQVDQAGIAWVAGGNGTIGFDVRPGSYPDPAKDDPATPIVEAAALLEPKVVARTGPNATADTDFNTIPGSNGAGDTVNDFIHHNSLRPDAADFVSRADGDTDPEVRDGELLLVTEEDIWNRDNFSTPAGCESQGSFQTWQVKRYGATGPGQGTVENLDTWTTEFNEVVSGDENPATGNDIVPTNGMCSAHYFDERDGMVAIAWYNQGVRFLDVSDPRDIEQVGFYAAPQTASWAAYWSPTARDIVYAVGANGIDVLRFKRGKAKRGGEVALRYSAYRRLRGRNDAQPHAKFGFACRLAPR
jgi:hypothetical protein